MHKRCRDGDRAGGSAVTGETELVICLAQVRLAARASGAMAARYDTFDDDTLAGQR